MREKKNKKKRKRTTERTAERERIERPRKTETQGVRPNATDPSLGCLQGAI